MSPMKAKLTIRQHTILCHLESKGLAGVVSQNSFQGYGVLTITQKVDTLFVEADVKIHSLRIGGKTLLSNQNKQQEENNSLYWYH